MKLVASLASIGVITMLARRGSSFGGASFGKRFVCRLQSSSSNEVEEVKTYVVEYKYVPNMLEKRTPYRAAHLEFAKPFVENKSMIAGGAFVPTVESGMLLFNCKRSVVEHFVKNDPYVVNGLVPEHKINEWAVAIGKVC